MIDLKPACEAMIEVLHGVGDDKFDNASPCSDYTVGDLINHVDQVARGASALAARDEDEMQRAATVVDAGTLDRDAVGTVVEHVRAVGLAWDDPAVWQGEAGVPGSDLSNETWGKIALTELVVHGWDIARATGQPFDLPEHTLQACFDHVVDFIPNAPVPGLWGPPVAVASDARLLDRIVAINGRTP